MKKRTKTVFITGGGTGGHVYPAVALYERIASEIGAKNVYYIADPTRIDKRIAEDNNMNFLPVIVSGMPRKFSFDTLLFLFDLISGCIGCMGYINKHKPSLIIGTGGYVSAPALIAGILAGVPIAIHDSDAYPGIVTRHIAPYAKFVNLSFKEARKHIKSRNVHFCGNPLRDSLNSLSKADAKEMMGFDANKKTILIMGGSQGAQTINDAVKSIVRDLIEDYGLQVIHQTGEKNYEDYAVEMEGLWWTGFEESKSYVLKPYFDDMSIPLSAADLAVCRAGSLSISELNLCSLPSILIPYPHAASNHQYHNAMAMQKVGASICLEDKNCNDENLKKLILDLIKDTTKLNQMSMANQKASKPDALNDFYSLVKKYLV